MAKEFLSQKGVPYTEIDVSRDRAAAMQMVRRTGQQGVPVIAVGDEYIVGFDRPRLEQALARMPRARPVFGAAIADAVRVLLSRGGAATAGAYVGRVKPDTPAARAGLKSGDVIVTLDGKSVETAAEMEAALANLSAGSVVTVTYLRDGERRSVPVRMDR